MMKNILHFSHINLNSIFGSVQEQAASMAASFTSFNLLLSYILEKYVTSVRIHKNALETIQFVERSTSKSNTVL